MHDLVKNREELINDLQQLQQEYSSLKALYDKDITERKQAADKLKSSEERWKIIFDYAPDAYYLHDLKGNFIDGNIAAEKFLGYNKNELIGKNFLRLNLLSPKYLSVAVKILAKNLIGQSTGPDELVINRKDGSKVIAEISSHPVKIKGRTVVLGMARDITERKQAENALRESELKFRSVSEMAPVAVFIYGQDSFEYANPESLKMLGYTEGEMAKMKFWEIIHPDDLQMVKDRGLSQLNAESIPSKYETRILTKDGQFIWVIFSAKLIDYQNKPAILGIAMNITERKQFEAEIKLKNEELVKFNTEKDKFFSIIAHDLRSPFQTFLGFTKMMAEELPTFTLDETQKIAVTMRDSANKLFNLLENLLEWSLMQRGIINFNPESHLLSNGIAASIELVRDAADKKMIGISSDIPEDLTVMVDPHMFESLMRNLVFNAVKFTPKGGKVTITAKSMPDSSVEISVKDTGIGMNKEMLDKLFRLDEQTKRQGTEGEPSTGLGLLLCQDFVHKHGGKIWAESEEGKGSVFYFTL